MVILTVSLMFLEQPITNIFCEHKRILFTSEHSGHVFCFLFHVFIVLFLKSHIFSSNLDHLFFSNGKVLFWASDMGKAAVENTSVP